MTLLTACAEQELAPIEQKSTQARVQTPRPVAPRSSNDAAPAIYRVVAGDTLYGIAWRFNLDARDIGLWNKLDDFNRIFVGQTLKLRAGNEQAGLPPAAMPLAKPVVGTLQPLAPVMPGSTLRPVPGPAGMKPLAPEAAKPVTLPETAPGSAVVGAAPATPPITPPPPTEPAAAPAPVATPATSDDGASRSSGGINWRWPASGKRRSTVAATGAAGLDITGTRGQPVYAAADGQVVYSGNGLRGYGQLIIIKHNDVFLSAYAHNDKLLAGEGAKVRAGQQIAVMGDSEADEVMLHFEIRKGGKAVEPMQFLPAR